MKRVLIKNMIHQQASKNQELSKIIQANTFGQGGKPQPKTISNHLRLQKNIKSSAQMTIEQQKSNSND